MLWPCMFVAFSLHFHAYVLRQVDLEGFAVRPGPSVGRNQCIDCIDACDGQFSQIMLTLP